MYACASLLINIAMLQGVEHEFKERSGFAMNTLCRTGARSPPLGAIDKQGCGLLIQGFKGHPAVKRLDRETQVIEVKSRKQIRCEAAKDCYR